MLQNRFVLGAVSVLLLLTCTLFVLQPTSVAHAQANIHVRDENGAIAIFGSIALKSGAPTPGIIMQVGVFKEKKHSENFRIIDQTVTDGSGRYKLWLTDEDVQKFGDDVSLLVRPDEQHTYRQDLVLEPEDITSVNILMSTPLIPIFPFTIFIY